ncbi:putative ACR, YggU family [Candidatus Norongarragalina meridionalis]|nr:putative ACR, YggU family [Candidatus Norongarragalina meridionalis]
MRFVVRVTPNAKETAFFMRDGVFCCRLKAKPLEGKANRELEETLSEALGKKVKIVRGAKSREKTCETDANEDDLKKIFDAGVAEPGQKGQ